MTTKNDSDLADMDRLTTNEREHAVSMIRNHYPVIVRRYVKELRDDLEQLQVQLAGCGVAAQGGTSAPQVAPRGSYGWSASYGDVLSLRQRFDARGEELRATRQCLSLERSRCVVLDVAGSLRRDAVLEDAEDVHDAFDLLEERLDELADEFESRRRLAAERSDATYVLTAETVRAAAERAPENPGMVDAHPASPPETAPPSVATPLPEHALAERLLGISINRDNPMATVFHMRAVAQNVLGRVVGDLGKMEPGPETAPPASE